MHVGKLPLFLFFSQYKFILFISFVLFLGSKAPYDILKMLSMDIP